MEAATAAGVPFGRNPAEQYAAARNVLYGAGYRVEILGSYEPSLHYVGEWWKQLFGESEGKEGKGIFPASVTLTADLHSMGQYIQEGERMLFETVVSVASPLHELRIGAGGDDAYGVGGLLYFFERACGISGYLLGVNPFDQPGVEAYKRNMYALLDKPGYEEEGRRLRERLKER